MNDTTFGHLISIQYKHWPSLNQNQYQNDKHQDQQPKHVYA